MSFKRRKVYMPSFVLQSQLRTLFEVKALYIEQTNSKGVEKYPG